MASSKEDSDRRVSFSCLGTPAITQILEEHNKKLKKRLTDEEWINLETKLESSMRRYVKMAIPEF